MQLVMFVGIPASGKSTFYKERFFHSHMRISLDLFNTRNKENKFLELAFSLQQRMVVDNTNVTKADRMVYIAQAKTHGYAVIGYYFEPNLTECLERNESRSGKEKINRIGVITKFKNLESPRRDEGFDELYTVRLAGNQFVIKQ
ncbi:ATP-binding protein [Dawidia soli]|uniref:AAA family ATPase n=1 Tax=Dawidia soli TaxID=2782352 RepID=A0AAP2DDE8_9BACT|nr:ATP-binding protein [Dawidia soli]MBT1689297.1 AAA family ATPase [Dawidia soli]